MGNASDAAAADSRPSRKRFVVCCLCFIGMVIVHSMRVNIAITVVTILDEAPHEKVAGGHPQELPDVDWSPSMVGLLHAVFYVGFLVTQVPGGYLATKVASHRIFGVCIIMSCAFNLLLPASISNFGYVLTCCLRLIQGLFEGAVIPALYKIIHDWSPRKERNSFAAFSITGMYAGAIVGFPLDGLLTHYANWQYVFYIHSILGFVWFTVWFFVVYETPEYDPSVSKAERSLILASREAEIELDRIPWRCIFSSWPVWGVIACHFVRSWMFFFLLTNEPAYLNVFDFTIMENGIFSATPHLLKVACCLLGGLLADVVTLRSSCSLTTMRKVFTCFGFGMEAACCYALSCTRSGLAALSLLNLGVGCSGFTVAGWQVNHLDLAPQFASVLVGISASFGTVGGILSPIVIGFMTHPQTLENWQKSFILTGTVLTSGAVVYFFLGSGEVQPWATKSLVINETPAATEETQLQQQQQQQQQAGGYDSLKDSSEEAKTQ